jgi:rod shape determining protein RodA
MLSLFLPLGILLAAGLVAISSISLHLFWLQLIWIAAGVGIVVLFIFVDWHFILNYRWIIGGLYVLSVLLLIFVYVKGPVIRNIRSWIVVGPITFQPVELMKAALILVYASYFSRRHLSVARWKNIFTSFVFFAIPAALAIIEPELGAAVIFFGIWFGFLILSGLPPRRVAAALLVFVILGILMWTYVLRDYQRERVVGFFYPERNVLGINYSSAQSKIAIGSAGFWGKGYKQGTQTQLGFLTEAPSDFVLSAFIEEWGVAGGLVVLASFLWLIFKVLEIGAKSYRNFEKFICLGAAIVFGLQFILNSGSELALMPVVGVTFPFLSYGGSSLISNFFLLSIVNAIFRKQR